MHFFLERKTLCRVLSNLSKNSGIEKFGGLYMTSTIISLVSIHRFSIESVLRLFLIEKEQPDLTYKATPPPVEKVRFSLSKTSAISFRSEPCLLAPDDLYTWVEIEKHCERKLSCPRTQHNVPSQGLLDFRRFLNSRF